MSARGHSGKLAMAVIEENLHKRWRVLAQLLFWAMVVVFPFVVGQYGNADAIFYKENYFYAVTGLALLGMFGCYCVALMEGKLPNMRLWTRFKAGALHEKALIVYALLTLVSFLFCADKSYALWGAYAQSSGLVLQACYISIFFIISRYYAPSGRDVVIAVAVAAATALIGIFQYLGYDPLNLIPPAYKGATGERIVFFSTMSNYNFYSPYLCVFLCLGMGWMVRREDKKSLLLLPALFAMFLMIMLAGARGGMVGLIGAVALGVPSMARDRQGFGKLLCIGGSFSLALALADWARVLIDGRTYGVEQAYSSLFSLYIIAGAVLLALGALLLFVNSWEEQPAKINAKLLRRGWYILMVVIVLIGIVLLPTVAERTGSKTLEEAAAMLSGDFDDNYASARLYIWKRLFTLVPGSPLIGYGPDGFNAAFNALYSYDKVDDWPESMEPAPGATIPVFDKAHNDFLQILIDGGILGFLAYVAFFAALLWAARGKTNNPLVAAGVIALLGYLVQSNFNYLIQSNGPVVWTAFAFLGAALRDERRQEGPAAA